MKKYLLLYWCILLTTMGCFAQNSVSITAISGNPDDEVEVAVMLENSDAITAVEVQIPLPDKQLRYVEGSAMLNADRSNGHQVSAAVVDGALRLYAYSLSLAPLKGNAGTLFTFTLRIGREPGVYTLQPQVVLSNAAGQAIEASAVASSATILTPKIALGATVVNYGHIPIRSTYTQTLTVKNTGTLPLVVNRVVCSDAAFTPAETQFEISAGGSYALKINYAPVKWGAVEATVLLESNAINGNIKATLQADPYSVNEWKVSNAEGIADEVVTVNLTLKNMEPIVGVQCAFVMPDGLEYVEGSFVGVNRAASLQTAATLQGTKLTLMLYSLQNMPIDEGDEVVATFQCKLVGKTGYYYLKPTDVVLSNKDLVNMVSATAQGYVYIKSPKISCATVFDMGKSPVTQQAVANFYLQNTGNAPLVIDHVTFMAEGYEVLTALPLQIANGKSATLQVGYTGTVAGNFGTTMNIYSNDPTNRMQPVTVSGQLYEPNGLDARGENLQNGNYVLSVGMNNYTDIVAVQMDVHWKEGMRTSMTQLAPTTRLAGHAYTVAPLDADSYRIIIYSMQNASVVGNEGDLFALTFVPDNGVEYKNTDIRIDNVVLSSAKGENFASMQALNIKAEFVNYYLRFVLEDQLISEQFLHVGDALVVPTVPEKEGYTFSGWGDVPTTMPAADVTYSGSYKLNSYNLIYKVDGEVYETVSVEYGSAITLLDEPVKEGYTFSGWSEAPTTMPASDIEVTGSFIVNSYNLIYKVDGEVYETVSLEYGTSIELLAEPIKEGYTFSGWSEAPTTMPASDIEVTGSFIVNSYNLIYKVDGEVYETVSLEYGTSIELLAEPIKEGYTFSGWSEVPTTMPASDVEVIGSFNVNSYNLVYKVDGEVYETVFVEYGSAISLLDEPIKTGYTFSGWGEAPATMPARDIEVIGSFNVNSYNLVYKVDGEVYETITLNYGTSIELLAEPTKTGYTFSGWSEAPATMPASDIEVTGSFVVNSYNLIYKVDGEVYQTVSVEYGAGVELLAEPTKEGYTFSGWSETPATMPANDIEVTGSFIVNSYNLVYKVDGEVYETITLDYGTSIELLAELTKEGYTFSGWSEAPATMPANDVEVVGNFSINSYTLTYKVEGEVYETITLNYGTSIELLAEPTKEGYSFSGWSEAPTTMPASDIEVTGSFIVNSYNLVYKVDGEVYETITLDYGTSIELLAEPTKEGYTFSGWSEAPTTMPASDVEISGIFTINTYTLTYLVDGEVTQTISVEYGMDLSSLADKPVKEGYSYVSVSVVPTTMPAHDLEIDGTFIPNSYNLIYKVGSTEYAVVSVLYGEEIVLIDEPTKEGYTFSGWSEAPSTMPAHDVEITGSFIANTYTITYLVDGEVYQTRTAKTGSLVNGLSNLQRDYCTFSGWESATPGFQFGMIGFLGSKIFIMPGFDVVIEGSFTCEEYNLIYKVDGEVYQTVSVVYGTGIELLPEPVKEGYTFSGWSEAPATMPANDVEVTGSFIVNSYNLIYKVDGEVYETVSVEYGDDIELLPEPTKAGFTFSGWSEAPPTMPASDVEILGSFNVNSYNLIYKVDGEVYETVSVEYGDDIELLPEPTKAGFTFSGWSEAPTTMPAFDIEIVGYFDLTTEIIEEDVVEEKNNQIYNLKGQRLKSLDDQPPGIYIVGGKKMRIVQTKQTNQR